MHRLGASDLRALAPYMVDRSYTNYLSADDHDRVRQAFGPNYERLIEVKRRYDPHGGTRTSIERVIDEGQAVSAQLSAR
jgi:hypothetical protein